MNKKTVVKIVLILILMATPFFAAQKQIIAVLDLVKSDGVSTADAVQANTLLRSEIARSAVFTMVERESMDKVMKEITMQMTGLLDSAKAVEVGKMFSASRILVGTIGSLYGRITITVRLVNVNNGSIVLSEDVTTTSADLAKDMAVLARKVANTGADTSVFIDLNDVRDLLKVRNFDKARTMLDQYVDSKGVTEETKLLSKEIDRSRSQEKFSQAKTAFVEKRYDETISLADEALVLDPSLRSKATALQKEATKRKRIELDPNLLIEKTYITIGGASLNLGDTSARKMKPEDDPNPNDAEDTLLLTNRGYFPYTPSLASMFSISYMRVPYRFFSLNFNNLKFGMNLSLLTGGNFAFGSLGDSIGGTYYSMAFSGYGGAIYTFRVFGLFFGATAGLNAEYLTSMGRKDYGGEIATLGMNMRFSFFSMINIGRKALLIDMGGGPKIFSTGTMGYTGARISIGIGF